MGSKLLVDCFPTVSDSSQQKQQDQQTFNSYTNAFETVCPYYMSIGVSYDDFWNGNFEICKYAREAEKIRKKRMNEECWWNSLYTFRALCDASVLFHDFMKEKPDLQFSTKEPLPMTIEEAEEQEKVRKQKEMEGFVAQMEAITKSHNALLRKQKEEEKEEQTKQEER